MAVYSVRISKPITLNCLRHVARRPKRVGCVVRISAARPPFAVRPMPSKRRKTRSAKEGAQTAEFNKTYKAAVKNSAWSLGAFWERVHVIKSALQTLTTFVGNSGIAPCGEQVAAAFDDVPLSDLTTEVERAYKAQLDHDRRNDAMRCGEAAARMRQEALRLPRGICGSQIRKSERQT